MKRSLDISEMAIDELSYPAVEMIYQLLRALNKGKEQRLSLQDPKLMEKIRMELLTNKSSSAMYTYIELLKEIKSDQKSSDEFKSRGKYKSIDPGSFNRTFKEELATGEYRRAEIDSLA